MTRCGTRPSRVLVSFVVVILAALTLLGCGGGGGSNPPPGNSSLPPVSTTQAATGITTSGAALNGMVNPNGMATEVWFEHGLASNLAGATPSPRQPIGSGVADVSVTYAASGWAAGTTYYYRVCASSVAGVTYGTIVSCTTGSPGSAPTVQTLAASGVGIDNAGLSGSVNPNSQATSAWFEWGTDSGLSTYSPTSTQSTGAGSSAVIVSASLASLSSGTQYYYRVAASNATGTSRGTIVSFTTSLPAVPPTVATLGATNIGVDNATVNGTVNPNGLATTAYFEWGTDAGLAGASTTPGQSVGSGNSNVAMNADLSGLSDNTTYYYRVVGTNSAGMSRGVIGSFTTSLQIVPPTVVTKPATQITISGATLNAVVNPNGSATNVRFRWGYSPAALDNLTPDQAVGAGIDNVSVSTAMNGATDNTLIYFRAEASNVGGTEQDAILSCTTLPNIVTFSGTLRLYTSLQFYSGIQLKARVDNPTGLDAPITATLQPGMTYKIIYVTYAGTMSEATWVVQDTNGNNLFNFVGGTDVNLGSIVSYDDARSTVTFGITGSYTGTSKLPVANLVGVWDTQAYVTTSTDPGWVVGQTYPMVDNIISQSGNQIVSYNSSTGLSFQGVIHDNLVIFSSTFWLSGWTNHYTEGSCVNAAGDRIIGKNEQTGVSGSYTYIIAADLVKTKRP